MSKRTTDNEDEPGLRLSERYGRFLLGHRRAFTIIITILSVAAFVGLVQLRFDGEPREIFKQADEDFAKLEEYFEHFGADDNSVIVILHGDQIFTPQFSKALAGFTKDARKTTGIASIVSIVDVPGPNDQALLPSADSDPAIFEAARQAAINHPFAAGHVISKSGNTILVTIELVEDNPQTLAKIRPIHRDLQDLKDKWFAALPIEATFAGSVAVRVETLVGVRSEFFQITAIGALIALCVALAVFRSPSTTLIVAAGPAIAVLWTLGLMGWLGLDIEGISTPLPTIVFVVAFANAVHLMMDIRNSRRQGQDPTSASRIALSHLGLACFLTALTTTIGFASLMLAETGSVQRFGLSTAMGSILGLFSNLTIVPLLASLAKRPPRRPPEQNIHDYAPRGFLALMAKVVTRFSLPITLLGIAITGVLLWSATQLKSDIVWTETLPADSESTRAMNLADQEFGGAMQAHIVVSWDESIQFGSPEMFVLLRELEALTEAHPTFRESLSILNFIPESAQALPPEALAKLIEIIPPEVRNRMLRIDRRRTVVSTRLPNSGAAATRPALNRLKSDLISLEADHPGFSLHVTGSAVIAAENMTNIIGDLVRSLSFASITVFLVLTIALRSLTLGLLSIIPNAFPLLLNAGILYYLDKPLQITSVLTFSICLGIAVDDTIHFLIRFLRERKRGADVRLAITYSFESVGLALLITTAIITGGFLAAMTSSMPGIVFFGGLACSALIAALIGDLVFLPAMLDRVLGKQDRAARRHSRQ